MSKVANSSARSEQSYRQADTQTRPPLGLESEDRGFTRGKRALGGRKTCGSCRHWKAFAEQWGRCEGDMVRRHVDGEAPLVTKSLFCCRFFAASRAMTNTEMRGAGRARDAEPVELV